MSRELEISVGQHSDKGRKETNQDFHGAYLPREPQRGAKGVVIAMADGISSSDVSHVASQYSVTGFLDDYFCTSDAWSVKKSAQRVLTATNSWLYSQTRRSQYRYDTGRGYVCTFSALIIKSATAHVFHVGDSRVYRLRDGSLEQLTNDHRVRVSEDTTYLSRALGMSPQLEIDYLALPVEQGDLFFLVTDGVYEYVSPRFVMQTVHEQAADLDAAARLIIGEALRRGSTDNLTAQIVRIDALPASPAESFHQRLAELPLPPVLEARMMFDGYRIIREVHASSRSHVYLATDEASGSTVVVKTPSIDLQGDAAYLERFLMEEWIARRINSAHVLKPCLPDRERNYLYVVTEFVDGQTLTQWMIDNPKPELETVRRIIEQIAKGLQAFHRMEMLHQDLRPDNIMIDSAGTVKIIDFGSTRVAGIVESAAPEERSQLLGTAQYTAPEYFIGEAGSIRSDNFSLGVIGYQMLSGKLPYGTEVAKTRTKSAQRKLHYRPLVEEGRDIPTWIDVVFRKAVQTDPFERYDELSEFLYDLRHPNKTLLDEKAPPLIERDPLVFWKCVSFVLLIIIAILLFR